MSSVKRIHHVGVAVRDLNVARAAIERLDLGVEVTYEEVMEQYGVRLAVLPVGKTSIELVQPTRPATRVGQWMDQRGDGLHHVCFEVEAIDDVLAKLLAKGIKLLDQVPRAGHHGSRIAFIDPIETPGLLIELLEPAKL